MSKKSFLLSDDWKVLFTSLPDEKAGQLIKAAFRYHTGEEVSLDDPVLAAVFVMVKEKIDENEARYTEKCSRNRQNIAKRWTEESVRKDTTVYDCIPNDTKAYEPVPNDTDNDNDNEKDKEKDKEKDSATQSRKRPAKHQYGEYKHILLTDKELETLNAEYGIDRTANAIRWFDAYIEEKGYKCKSHYLAMRRWVFNAVDEKKKPRAGPKGPQWNIEKHEYDMGDLESRLIGG